MHPETDILEPQLNRRLLAVLYADLEGFGRLAEADEDATVRRVCRAITLFRTTIRDYGGLIVDTAGDAVIATFSNATNALTFAIDLQRVFRDDAVWTAGSLPVRFRIGITLGEVIVSGRGLHGRQMILAERLQRIAPAGGIVVDASVCAALAEPLRFRLVSVGRPPLKNIDTPPEVFEVRIDGPDPGGGGWRGMPMERPTRIPPASIVVLPFRNMSGDAADDHVCDALTGEVISNLTRFRDLLVIARHSAFAFRGAAVGEADFAHIVGTRYVLTGGLQRGGTRLRVTAQLADADDGRVVWSERYDGEISDVFAFQDDVTSVIVARLAVHIAAAERERGDTRVPDLQAYGLVLRGQELALRYHREANLLARHLFEQASELDPHYGRSFAGLSRTHNLVWRYRWDNDPGSSLDRAVQLANDAVTYDPLDARGWAELGYAQLYKKAHDPALDAYERAIELNPNDADILAEAGDCFSYAGQSDRAADLLHRAIRLNPFRPDWYLWNLGDVYFNQGDYAAAIRTLTQMRDLAEAHRMLAASHAHLGDLTKAKEHATEVLRVHPDFTLAHWRTVPPMRRPEDIERYIEGLRIAGLR